MRNGRDARREEECGGGEEGDSFLTLAFARTDGGMTLSGLKACRGSTKEVRILPHFLHSAIFSVSREERRATTMDTSVAYCANRLARNGREQLTRHGRGKGVVDTHGYWVGRCVVEDL